MAGPVAFVGREGKLSRLLGAMREGVRLALVVGDAGVGKTRLVGEVMAQAAAAGMVTVRGECLPLAGTLPLLPVATAIGELGRLDGGALLLAALDAAPEFVRAEAARLLPGLGSGDGTGLAGQDGGWRLELLFAGVAELLAAAAGVAGAEVGLVVEDVHWADTATLDFLTFLSRAGRRDGVTVVATCRSDEAPVAAGAAEWLAQARGAAGVEEIALGPLSREEVAGQVAALAGGPAPPGMVDELYARAGGNPFFTEQLVAAAAVGPDADVPCLPAGLPGRLAELLAARARRCAGDARVVLAGLAGRPLREDLLAAVTGLDVEAVRGGLRDLAAARLLADDTRGGVHRPRHALLAEAVSAGLLPGERAMLHERTARALQQAGDSLAAEAARHWQAAGRPAEELPVRVAAAGAAERVFGYAQAAAHWLRAIELCHAVPDVAVPASIEVPRMYVRAVDALEVSGNNERAAAVAEEAYRRFACHPDPATAAVIRERVAVSRKRAAPDAGLDLIKEALRLFEQAPPSADHAEAWLRYATMFLFEAKGQHAPILDALTRALEIAEAAGADALIARILVWLAADAFFRGQIEDGFALLHRGRAVAQAARDSEALLRVAVTEGDALLCTGQFQSAIEVSLRGLETARKAGRGTSYDGAVLAGNAALALLAGGRTAEAAALIDPLTTGPPDRDRYALEMIRAEIDLLRGEFNAAARRLQLIKDHIGSIDHGREVAQRAAELASWAGRPGDALEEVRRALTLFTNPYMNYLFGRVLAVGMRACADLAERAAAKRDAAAARAAVAAVGELTSWVDQMAGAPFTDHPFMAAIPAERATWDAERTRLAGPSDPEAWSAAASRWRDLSCPHRAGYAWWRQAQAQLDAGQPATAAAPTLRAAVAAADGHAPLQAHVRALAERARITLQTPAATTTAPPPAKVRTPFGLTSRELAVLRLLAAGKTNAQIGAELYISPTTAGVHVSNILRKLGVSSRVQAAALAERAGLLALAQP
jgi:DNA-binding CsgD family transcriptional regulator/tetratricopeptide (TPR) repeat protein